jgi:hypothetical protein
MQLLHFFLWIYCRTTRSKLRERNAASSPTFPCSSSVAGSSPTAGPSGLVDELVNASGYNSGDEYGPCESECLTETEWLEVIWFCFLSYDVCGRLCCLVVRLPGCRPRGPGFYSWRCQIFWVAVGLERGPPSPCVDKWGATWKKSSGSSLQNWD